MSEERTFSGDAVELAEAAHEAGRWDGICEVGTPNAPVVEKASKAKSHGEILLDAFIRRYSEEGHD